MSDLLSTHLKKIRLMGNIIIGVSIVSLILTALIVVSVGWLYAKFGDEMNLAEIVQQRAVATGDGAINKEAPHLEAIPTKSIKLGQILPALVVSAVYSLLMSIFLLAMGLSWRRKKPFSPTVVFGLRGLGVTLLLQSLTSLLWPKSGGEDADAAIEMVNSYPSYLFVFIPLMALGLLLLTLSWVIDNGRMLFRAEELTV